MRCSNCLHELDPDDQPEDKEPLCATCEAWRDECARDKYYDRLREELLDRR